MYRHMAGAAVLMVLASSQLLTADDQSTTQRFTLQHMKARDAATVLRTIAGIRQLTAPDDHSLEIVGAETPIQLSAELMRALDTPDVTASQSFTTGDDTVVAVIPLGHVSPADAMMALRKLSLQRIATSLEPDVVVVRDSAEQVAIAIATIDDMSAEGD
jgi:hypothetical protein